MSTRMSPIDLFRSLPTKDKQKVLALLRKSEPTPCERLGHKFKITTVETGWFTPPVRKAVCERCAKQIVLT